MKDNGVQCEGFKGFVANRFGRIAELAQEYLKCATQSKLSSVQLWILTGTG